MNTYLKSAITAVVSGGATAAMAYITDPATFNVVTGWKMLLAAFASGAVVGLLNYLRAAPSANKD